MITAARRRDATTALLIVALGALTIAAVFVGSLPWPQRVWVPGTRSSMVGRLLDEPLPVWLLLIATAAVTIATALVLFRRLPEPAPPRWFPWVLAVLLVVTAAVGSLNALFFAGPAGPSVGPIIPIFHWMFTFVPSLVIGSLGAVATGRHGLPAALAAAVVAVPMQALSWSLLVRFNKSSPAVLNALWPTAILVVIPFLISLAIVMSVQAGRARDRAHPQP
ncbi:hypothetical protein JL107_09470 [Nakamurella flavida]|uniref:Uncharacterized protein n=1 Tax=Nakamurella flavida TaxID=363630 RepID=A0A939C335_9ACTN|nr:hypothetical protein [Nakamurella flavida]MBM9476671.1 hypothetical protein [Nakamurella flavida]MDP9778891.1 FtsH-binding integral membrane protein [Nakamurella flavida]